MRIAHVITRMIVGGAQENTLFNCLDLVRDHDDEVILITGPALGPEGDLLEQGRGGELRTVMVNALRRNIHPWNDWRAYRALKREIKAFRPDVVHTHSAKAGLLGRAAAWSLKIPAVVHTIHGAPFHPFQRPMARKLFQTCERWAAKRCHKLISVADAMTELMVDANIAPADRFQTIYSGMDTRPFLDSHQTRSEVRRELGYDDEHIVVGKIARLFHLKGHEYLIDAAGEVIGRCPQVRFLLVGDGILRDDMETRIRNAGLSDHFQFTGLVPPSRIPSLVGAMDILAHTSLREGLARTLPQALLAGKPVVSFDIDGAREVCRTGETGVLVPPRDTAGLRDGLMELALDPAKRQRYGRTGQTECASRFDHRAMTGEIRQLYRKLLDG